MSLQNPSLNISGSTDAEIIQILKDNSLSLTVEEAKKIVDMLGRNPTLTEGVIFSIQGSEHSSYKSSKKFLYNLLTDGKHVILGPKEDAGIVELAEINGEKYGLVYSHESHNSPSQLVPYEGAATGVGGICRDIACMGARVIGVLDGLRFGDEEKTDNKIIARGVVEGISGYGNPLGVPNMGGDIFFDKSFDGFTLVNVVALGLVKEKDILHSYVPQNAAKDGYELIVVGKASDRSGFGGASFSSAVVDETEKEKNLGAVQEPNPFLERHLLASFQDLFKKLDDQGDLQKIAFKDMGAGGIMCASIELAEGAGFGAEVNVEDIHTGEDGLPPHIILCSETQERFCFAVPPELTDFVLDHFNKTWDLPKVSVGAKASKVGKITDDGMYRVKWKGEMICEAKANEITEGLLIDRPYDLPSKDFEKVETPEIENWEEFLPVFMSSVNIASDKPVSENYDQSVQNATYRERSKTDAVTAAPLRDFEELSDEEKKIGFSVSIAGSPTLGRLSPYLQGAFSVVNAIQKVAATGASPRALTDCLNYGNPEEKEDMGKFVDGVTGVADASKKIKSFEAPDEGIPFVSGNVSLYKKGNPSAICSCVGQIPNVEISVGNVAKDGDEIFVIGNRSENLGGSLFYQILEEQGGVPPEIDFQSATKKTHAVIELIRKGKISSASALAEGGFITALIKTLIKGNSGFTGNLENFSVSQLFSEDEGFLISVSKENTQAVKEYCTEKSLSLASLGTVESDSESINTGIFDIEKSTLLQHWEEGLRQKVFA